MFKTISTIFNSAIISLATYNIIGEIGFPLGPSMLPTLQMNGDVVIVSRWLSDLKHGDVIAFISPMDPNVKVIKRIIGLEGDVVYINPLESHKSVQIPKGHVWVAGDNTTHSKDSRTYGSISKGLIIGKVVYKLFPKFSNLQNPLSLEPQLIHPLDSN